MLIIAGAVRVPNSVKAALQAPMETFVTAVRAEPGCRAFTFAWDTLDPEIMRIFEIYDDETAFAAHKEAAHTKIWRSAREQLGVVPRDLVSYTISTHRTL